MATESWKLKRGGDLLPHIESFQYNLKSLPVVNEGASAIKLSDSEGANGVWQVAGYPVVIAADDSKASLVEVGLTSYDEAQCNGLLVQGPEQEIAAGGTSVGEFAVIWNGPGAINESVIPTADGTDTGFTLASLKAAIDGAWDTAAKWLTGPPNEEVQTT